MTPRAVTTSELRTDLANVVDQATHKHERITVTRRGKNVAAVIPIEDLELLEFLEDRADVNEALRVMTLPENQGKGESLDDVIAELDL